VISKGPRVRSAECREHDRRADVQSARRLIRQIRRSFPAYLAHERGSRLTNNTDRKLARPAKARSSHANGLRTDHESRIPAVPPAPHRLAHGEGRLLAVQPFSIGGHGGGPRIMRSLLDASASSVLAVETAARRGGQVGDGGNVPELYLPIRPSLGRVESTRANRVLGVLDIARLENLTRRVMSVARGAAGPQPRVPATCLHAVLHSLDFIAAHRASTRLQLPLFLSVHDDPSYVLRGRAERSYALQRAGEAWQAAQERFVISSEMGITMCARYGERSYVTVTDGLDSVASSPHLPVTGRLTVYFMGAAHLSYAENFNVLFEALSRLRSQGVDAKLITRAGGFAFNVETKGVPVESRPWAPQADVIRDFDDVDVAYMPLPFGPAHAEFVRCSMSTKMVTYLGSGVPILFHGPGDAAAANLLRGSDAALIAGSADADALASVLAANGERQTQVAANALRLAREQFLLSDIRARFWKPITDCISNAGPWPAEP
jgi:hypothetical protein